MTKPVVTIDPKKSVFEAAKLMNKNDIGAVVIVDKNKKPKGILTERDVLRLVAQGKDLSKIKVQTVMSKKVKSTDIKSTVMEVSKIMHDHSFRRIIITKNQKLAGMMTDKNLIELMSG